jgi:hypothetical protein
MNITYIRDIHGCKYCLDCGDEVQSANSSTKATWLNSYVAIVTVTHTCAACNAVQSEEWVLVRKTPGDDAKHTADVFDVNLLVSVDSEAIRQIGYDAKKQILAVQFLSHDEIYQYKVQKNGERLFIEFLCSNSKGKFFSANIKGMYERIN